MKINLDKNTLELFDKWIRLNPYLISHYEHASFEYGEIIEQISNEILENVITDIINTKRNGWIKCKQCNKLVVNTETERTRHIIDNIRDENGKCVLWD